MHDKHRIIEEPCELKDSRTVLKTSGFREGLAEFTHKLKAINGENNSSRFCRAKSISDASWAMFIEWVEYFAKLHKIVTVAVPPQYTSQDCSSCGHRVQKTLSERTHQCLKCGLKMHRDMPVRSTGGTPARDWLHNSAKVILVKGLETLGVKQSTDGQSGTQACGENHLWLVEGNFGWVSGLDEAGNPKGNSMESRAIPPCG